MRTEMFKRTIKLEVEDIKDFNENTGFWNDMELVPDPSGESNYFYLLDHAKNVLYGGHLKNNIFKGNLMYANKDDDGFLTVRKNDLQDVSDEEIHRAYENFIEWEKKDA